MTDKPQALAVQQPAPFSTPPSDHLIALLSKGPAALFLMPGAIDYLNRAAGAFAHSMLVPDHLRGKIADCVIMLAMAQRLGEDPLTLMQESYLVKGKASFSGKYQIGRLNRSGLIKGRIKWRTGGEFKTQNGKILPTSDKWWEAYVIDADDGEEVCFRLDWSMVVGEGWVSNSKWHTMPEVMGRYRSGVFLIRLNYPDVMLSSMTTDELFEEPEYAPERVDLGEATVVTREDPLGLPSQVEEPEVIEAEPVEKAAKEKPAAKAAQPERKAKPAQESLVDDEPDFGEPDV